MLMITKEEEAEKAIKKWMRFRNIYTMWMRKRYVYDEDVADVNILKCGMYMWFCYGRHR